jgi:hypothetical protein
VDLHPILLERRRNPTQQVVRDLGYFQEGYELELSKELKSFNITWADIIRYWFGSDEDHSRANADQFGNLLPDVLLTTPFDFVTVILGASIIYSDTPDNRSDVDRLLVAQLIVGFPSIRQGGTLAVKLTHIERVMTAKLLYLFRIPSQGLGRKANKAALQATKFLCCYPVYW